MGMTILFSVPAVRIFNCCLYDLDFLNDVTSEMEFDCEALSCSYSTASIWLPLVSFISCALLTYQQVHNIYRYLHDKKVEHDNYDRLIHQLYPSDSAPADENGVDLAMA